MRGRSFNLEKELAEKSEKDWRVGAIVPKCISELSMSERDLYLPVGELQANSKGDTDDCADRGPANILETKFTKLYQRYMLSADNRAWLENKGYVVDGCVVFADAFNSILSGTTRNGNSLKAPLESIRTQGLVPKHMAPFLPDMSWDDYMNPARITQEMIDLGKAFAARFTINYYQESVHSFEELLQTEMIDCACYAWPDPINGQYPKTDGPFNHCVVIYKTPKWNIFDNYLDWNADDTVQIPGKFTKKLAPDYDFYDTGYIVIITSQNDVSAQISKIQQLIKAIQAYFALLFPANAASTPPAPQPVPTPTPEPPNPAPKYDWSNPTAARHSVRVICDEEGLTVEEKNELCKTVSCESGFDPKRTHANIDEETGKLETTDYGICQINDYWHIGPKKDFPSVAYVLNNPETCVRWMCKIWKTGENGKKLWECFKKKLI